MTRSLLSNSFVFNSLRAVLGLCSFSALAAGATADNPLSSRVSAYTAHDEPRLMALIRFARENGIALGIESSTADLDRIVTVQTQSTDARNAITMILGNSRRYSLSALQGVVSIRDRDVQPPSWLDRKSLDVPIAAHAGRVWLRKSLDDSRSRHGPFHETCWRFSTR